MNDAEPDEFELMRRELLASLEDVPLASLAHRLDLSSRPRSTRRPARRCAARPATEEILRVFKALSVT